MKKETFKDDKMKSLLGKKDVLITEGRDLTKQIEDMEAQRNKLALKIQKIKDKMVTLIEKREFKLDEFEYLKTVELKGDQIEVEVGNAQDDWVRAFKEQQEEAAKS